MDIGGLADRILGAWRESDARHRVEDESCGLPDKADIEALLDTTFFASIQREEGRFITFSLMFLQTHKQTQPRHMLGEDNPSLAFSEPIELSVQAVRKLAGSIDERAATLIVEKRDGRYLITGIAPFGRSSSRLSAVAGGYPRPEALTISVRSPGSLLVSRANGNLGRFVGGTFEAAQVTPFHSRALGSDLIAQISTHDAHARLETTYWHWYRDALEHMLRSASEKGHGGSIVWLPRRQAELALQQTRLGYRLEGRGAVYDAFLELARHARVRDAAQRGAAIPGPAAHLLALSAKLPELRVKATTLLDTLAQITCIDGATLIDDYFQPLVFGARLAAPEWTGPVLSGPTPSDDTGEPVLRSRFGTRHNSAIDFVAAVPGAIAFVLSQDGPVRALTRRNDSVLLWPDCLNTMFAD